MSDLGWHVISGEHLLEALRRAQTEDPDALMAELWANAEVGSGTTNGSRLDESDIRALRSLARRHVSSVAPVIDENGVLTSVAITVDMDETVTIAPGERFVDGEGVYELLVWAERGAE